MVLFELVRLPTASLEKRILSTKLIFLVSSFFKSPSLVCFCVGA